MMSAMHATLRALTKSKVAVADSSQSAVLQQVSNGVHVRMAVLFHLLVGSDQAVTA